MFKGIIPLSLMLLVFILATSQQHCVYSESYNNSKSVNDADYCIDKIQESKFTMIYFISLTVAIIGGGIFGACLDNSILKFKEEEECKKKPRKNY